MKKRIPKKDIERFVPDYPGSVRVNHDSPDCRGESASLLITRRDKDVTGYCFRCGGRCHYWLDRRFIPNEKRFGHPDTSGFSAVGGVPIPLDAEPASEGMSKEAREWVSKAGIITPVIDARGFLWSDQEGALYIPVQQDESAFGPVLVGWVKRGFSPKSYKTLRMPGNALWGYYRQGGATPLPGGGQDGLTERSVAIVEDVLSGLRCSEVCDTIALCGTNLHKDAINLIIREKYVKVKVFLDADHPTVKMQARKIAASLSWLDVEIIETGKDPKHYSKGELEKLLC